MVTLPETKERLNKAGREEVKKEEDNILKEWSKRIMKEAKKREEMMG
ncbi:MAG: hypothetical protein QW701_02070 [Candidatus Nezhaarchaeales archaeon]